MLIITEQIGETLGTFYNSTVKKIYNLGTTF